MELKFNGSQLDLITIIFLTLFLRYLVEHTSRTDLASVEPTDVLRISHIHPILDLILVTVNMSLDIVDHKLEPSNLFDIAVRVVLDTIIDTGQEVERAISAVLNVILCLDLRLVHLLFDPSESLSGQVDFEENKVDGVVGFVDSVEAETLSY